MSEPSTAARVDESGDQSSCAGTAPAPDVIVVADEPPAPTTRAAQPVPVPVRYATAAASGDSAAARTSASTVRLPGSSPRPSVFQRVPLRLNRTGTVGLSVVAGGSPARAPCHVRPPLSERNTPSPSSDA